MEDINSMDNHVLTYSVYFVTIYRNSRKLYYNKLIISSL